MSRQRTKPSKEHGFAGLHTVFELRKRKKPSIEHGFAGFHKVFELRNSNDPILLGCHLFKEEPCNLHLFEGEPIIHFQAKG